MPLREIIEFPADEAIFHMLVQYGASIAFVLSQDGWNILRYILGSQSVAKLMVQTVIESGYVADMFEQENSEGETPLDYLNSGIEEGWPISCGMLDQLIQYDIDVSKVDVSHLQHPQNYAYMLEKVIFICWRT